MRRILLALSIVVLSISIAFAQVTQSTDSPQASKWTVDDIVMAEQLAGFQISPDARWIVWVKSIADKEKNGRVSNIILSSLA